MLDLIEEQLRNKQISPEEAFRRAADECYAAGLRNLEYILRRACGDEMEGADTTELREAKEEIEELENKVEELQGEKYELEEKLEKYEKLS